MTYKQFIKELNQYYELYDLGLKKKANEMMACFVKKIEMEENLNHLLNDFAHDLFDENKSDSFKVRNGNLPYYLNNLLAQHLIEEGRQEKMPHMRWAYELLRHNGPYSVEVHEMLEKAYAHSDCDVQTVFLVFDRVLNLLDFGMHHIPEGYVIDKEVIEREILKGKC